MLIRLKILLVGFGLSVSKKLEAFFSKAIANIAISELTKAVQGKSSILTFEPSCALDEVEEGARTRDSLKIWQHRTPL